MKSNLQFMGLSLICSILIAATATCAEAGTIHDTFTLAPGASHKIVLPAAGAPVQVTVSVTANNGGTQTPSEIGYAVVNEDVKSRQVTWVGTSSDGSTQAGTSIPTGAAEVLDIGGGSLVVTAVAGTSATSAGYGSLIFTQSATRTVFTYTYAVTLNF